jgi:hypothetical protein
MEEALDVDCYVYIHTCQEANRFKLEGQQAHQPRDSSKDAVIPGPSIINGNGAYARAWIIFLLGVETQRTGSFSVCLRRIDGLFLQSVKGENSQKENKESDGSREIHLSLLLENDAPETYRLHVYAIKSLYRNVSMSQLAQCCVLTV